MALLLAQEFGLYDTIKLWDYIFSFDDSQRFFFLYCLCIAILKLRRKVILENDFITALPLIQKLKDLDVDQVIKLGLKLFEKYCKVNHYFPELFYAIE